MQLRSQQIPQTTFEIRAYMGLSQYGFAGKQVRSLVLTKNKSDQKDIMEYFEILVDRISKQFKRVDIQYILCCVQGQHIHCLFKSPYVEYPVLTKLWNEISQNPTGVYIKQIQGDKTQSLQMKKLVDYLLIQKVKHDTLDIRFFQSEKWGYVPLKKKKKVEIKIIPDVTKPEGYYTQEIEIQKESKQKKIKTLKQIAYELKHKIDE